MFKMFVFFLAVIDTYHYVKSTILYKIINECLVAVVVAFNQ